MSAGLPLVAGSVLADAVDALSPRLRKRLDDTAAKATAWEVAAEDGRVVVTVDDETQVVLTLNNGAVRTSEATVCSCLLAPACLHRAAILGIAPALEDADPAGAGAGTGAVTDTGTPENAAKENVTEEEDAGLSAEQATALAALQAVAAELIDVGLIGSGLATEATLRRAVHAARAVGLYGPAATGGRVATQLRSYRTRAQDHRLAVYADDLRALIETVRALSTTTDRRVRSALIGAGRRSHEQKGGMRLTGLFSEPVIAGSGMAGVVTCAVDADGVLWSVPAVTPGGPERVEAAYKGPVGLGGAALSHRDLLRAGLIVSGAAASADGSLSHGAGVRAVRASGATWWEAPIDGRFAEPLAPRSADSPTDSPDPSSSKTVGQLARVFATSAADRSARIGADMLFCEVVVLPLEMARAIPGSRPGDVPVGFGGTTALLRSPDEHKALAYADNLNILRLATGLRLRLVARPDRTRAGILYPLAASPDPNQEAGLHLPESWQGRICLGIDRLHDSMVIARQAPENAPALLTDPTDPTATAPATRTTQAHIPIHLLRNAVERTAAGGRRTARFASARQDASLLRSSGMPNAAAVMEHLSLTASAPERDDYGRPIPTVASAFAEAWFAAALFEAAASADLAVQTWSAGQGAADDLLEVQTPGQGPERPAPVPAQP